MQLFTKREPGKPSTRVLSVLLRYGSACVLVALALLVTLAVPAIPSTPLHC